MLLITNIYTTNNTCDKRHAYSKLEINNFDVIDVQYLKYKEPTLDDTSSQLGWYIIPTHIFI